MIVECPRCRARYRVESGLLERDQTFKCSRCSHIFAYEAERASETAEREPRESTQPAAENEPAKPEPRTRLDARPERDGNQGERPPADDKRPTPRRDAESMSLPFSRPGSAAEPGPSRFGSPPTPSAADREFSFVEDDQHHEGADDEYTEADEEVADEPRFVRDEEDLRVDEEDLSSAGRPYLLFLAILVIIYAILALDLLNHSAQAEKLLASVPFIGDVLAEDHLLQTRVQLQDVEGAYQQIKDERAVFIISGRAVNTSPQALKGVQIESTLYDPQGKSVDAKTIYCGNAMSLKIVKDLSTKEISLLQRLEPPKRFEIRPGESAGFSVVFVNPPRGLKEFTARVAAAQSSAS